MARLGRTPQIAPPSGSDTFRAAKPFIPVTSTEAQHVKRSQVQLRGQSAPAQRPFATRLETTASSQFTRASLGSEAKLPGPSHTARS